MLGGTFYSFQVTRVMSIFIQGDNPCGREPCQALTLPVLVRAEITALLIGCGIYNQRSNNMCKAETPRMLLKQACVQNTVFFQLQYCFSLPPAGARGCNATAEPAVGRKKMLLWFCLQPSTFIQLSLKKRTIPPIERDSELESESALIMPAFSVPCIII